MKSVSVCLAAAVLLFTMTGCAEMQRIQQEKKARIVQVQENMPVCDDDKECEIKWAAARRWVLQNSGMKIQHLTDDYIETYNSVNNSPNLAVRVIKEPQNDGTYKITMTCGCANVFGCNPDVLDAMESFNAYVNGSVNIAK
ncbi:PDZ domain-containing protein [Desulfonema ishimotonii]|uniref:PDZ domain-containing protein n=1 Tax=Desulfonema ishimotonii TaxID=45657 RepID=A0A401FZV3_9BACT|nr:hypothetical protein [Desulfonema ishimotonii]GBC62501.1 PDZ domain-containing protein [Desulfonema ishimotonii]